jgi:hypothetical protein
MSSRHSSFHILQQERRGVGFWDTVKKAVSFGSQIGLHQKNYPKTCGPMSRKIVAKRLNWG